MFEKKNTTFSKAKYVSYIRRAPSPQKENSNNKHGYILKDLKEKLIKKSILRLEAENCPRIKGLNMKTKLSDLKILVG